MTSVSQPPVVLLGGTSNALSIARSLGRRGITVLACNQADAHVALSRFCRHLPAAGENADSWIAFLLSDAAHRLQGAVLLACSDEALEAIANQRDALAQRYLLDESNPEVQLLMLNKFATYELAQRAGVPTPRFWQVQTVSDVHALQAELVFPLIVKPLLTHRFEDLFGAKFLEAKNMPELLWAFSRVEQAGIECMLVEKIVGPDDLLCSYYTYLNAAGEPQFHFTKRVLRRFPKNMGGATYHETDWNPEVAQLSQKFLASIDLRGLANLEFKRDERDGRLKLMECNARFTAANGLVLTAGYDLAGFIYDRLTGRPMREFGEYRRGLRLWYPVEDLKAFLQLRAKGELNLWTWLRNIMHPWILPYFQWSDPLPSLVTETRRVRRLSLGLLSRVLPRKQKTVLHHAPRTLPGHHQPTRIEAAEQPQ